MWAKTVVGSLLAALPASACASEFRLIRLTGVVEIRNEYEIRDIARSALMPVAIRPGSRLRVLTGKADFEARDLSLRARAGDSFSYGQVLRGLIPIGIRLAATGPRTSLLLDVRDSTAVLYEGDAVTVVESPGGGLEVQARAGFLTLSMPGEDRVLAPGQVALLPPLPERGHEPPLAPSPAVSDDLRIVEPGELLRSAVGPKPVAPAPSGGCRHP